MVGWRTCFNPSDARDGVRVVPIAVTLLELREQAYSPWADGAGAQLNPIRGDNSPIRIISVFTLSPHKTVKVAFIIRSSPIKY